MLDQLYASMNMTSIIVINIAIMIIAGFLMTRLTKLAKLPNVTAYIIVGALIGPYCLDLIHDGVIHGLDFITDITLAFIAFEVGKNFSLKLLKENGLKMLVITLLEVTVPFILVTLCMYFCFGYPIEFALIVGSIASAISPASTLMTIKQYKAKGEYVNTLLQVIAFNNILSIFVFNICTAIAGGITNNGTIYVMDVILPILYNLLVVAIAIALGFLLKRLINAKRTVDNRLLLTLALLLTITGICTALDISPLLACLAFGATYINISNDKNLFAQINSFSPPIMTIFFVLGGLKLDFGSLLSVGLVGIVYLLLRIVAKYLGAYLGAKITGSPKSVQRFLGLALIPQAGVAIGLATLAQRSLPPDMGYLMLTMILATSFIYEIIGPVSAKYSLNLSGSIKDESITGKKKYEQLAIDNMKNVKYNKKQVIKPIRILDVFLKKHKDEDEFYVMNKKERQKRIHKTRTLISRGEIQTKEGVRVVLINENEQILFMLTEDKYNTKKPAWQLVGGIIRDVETLEECTKRQLLEEANINCDDLDIKGVIWKGTYQTHINNEKIIINQNYVLVYTNAKNINIKNLEGYKKDTIKFLKWFSADEIRALKNGIYPSGLKKHLLNLIEGLNSDEIITIDFTKNNKKRRK